MGLLALDLVAAAGGIAEGGSPPPPAARVGAGAAAISAVRKMASISNLAPDLIIPVSCLSKLSGTSAPDVNPLVRETFPENFPLQSAQQARPENFGSRIAGCPTAALNGKVSTAMALAGAASEEAAASV